MRWLNLVSQGGAVGWDNADPGVATFAGTPGTVTLADIIAATRLSFTIDGYLIAASSNPAHALSLSIGIDAKGDTTIAAPLVLSAANSWNVAGGKALTVSGPISGGFGLTKTGAGSLTLSGSNTFTGATTLAAGTLVLGHTAALANSTLELVGTGAVSFATQGTYLLGGLTGRQALNLGGSDVAIGGSGASSTYFGAVSGTGGLTKAGAGMLTLTGAHSYTGLTTINDGTLRIVNVLGLGTNAAGTVVNSGGALDLSIVNATPTVATEALALNGTGVGGTGAVVVNNSATWSGGITVASASSLNTLAGATLTASGGLALTGTGALTKTGLGTLALTANSTGTAGLVVNAGIVTSNASVTWAGSSTVNAGGTQQVTGAGTNAITDTQSIAVNAGGALDWQQTGAETFAQLNLTGTGLFGTGALVNNAATAGGALTLTGGVVLGGDTTIGAGSGGSLNLGTSVISGTGFGLTKVGAGTITTSGANTYSGPTTLTGGTLTVSGAAGAIAASSAVTARGGLLSLDNTAGNVNRIGDTVTVTLGGGGGLSLIHNATTNTTETIGTLALAAGNSTVTVSSTTSRVTTLAGAGLSRAAGATAFVRGTSLSQSVATNVSRITLGSTAGLSFVGTNTLNNGGTSDATQALRIVPYLFGDTSASGTGNNFVTYDTTLGLRVLVAGQQATLTAASTTAASPINAIGFNGNVTATALTLNSLLFSTTGQTLGGATSTALTINSGAIASTIAAATIAATAPLTLGNGTWNEGVITVAGTGTNNLTIASTVGVTGSGGLTKAGGGILTLSNTANTYSGGTVINQGLVNFAALGSLGSGGITFAGGGLQWGTGNTADISGRTVTFAGPATLDVGANNVTLVGGVGNGGTGGLVKAGSGMLTLGAANSFTGGTTLSAGTLSFTAANQLGTLGGTVANGITLAGGSFQAANASGTIDLSAALVNLTGTATVDVPNAGGTLRLGPVIGSGALTKTGAGTLTIVGDPSLNSPFSGNKTFNGGTTNVSGNFASSGTGVVTVAGAAGNAILNIQGGRFVQDSLLLGTIASGNGAVFQAGGSVQLTRAASTSVFAIGNAAGGYGSYRLSGGDLTAMEVGVGGSTGASLGMLDVTGGTLNVGGWLTLARGAAGSTGVMTVSGGTVNLLGTAGTNPRLYLNQTAGNTSILTISGGSVIGPNTPTYTLDVNNGGNSTGIVNLNGGELQVSGVIRTAASTSPILLNFDGGTLRYAGNATTNPTNASFLANVLSGAYVYGGGAVIDDNGGAITIAQPLLAPTGNGITSIPVGTAGSGYIAPPVVSISGGGGVGATAVATVDTTVGSPTYGQITGFTVTNRGTGYTSAPTITLTGGGGTGGAVGTATFAANATTGGLTKIGYGTLTLTGANTFGGGLAVNAGTVAVTSGGSLPGLDVSGRNRVASGATLTLANGVSDADLASIVTNTAWSPGSLLGLDTSLGNRAQSGGLSGAFALSKLGANTLTLSGTNTFSGGLAVNAGTVVVNGLAALPGNNVAGRNSVAAGGTLVFGNSVSESDYAATIAATTVAVGSFLGFDTAAGDRVLASAITGFSGLAKLGPNTLTLGAGGTFTGALSVAGGTLLVAGDNTLGGGSYAGGVTLGTGATLSVATSANQTFSGGFTGAGTLAKSGAGTLTLSHPSNSPAAIALTVGTLALASVNTAQNALIDVGAAGAQSLSFAVAGTNTYVVGGLQGGDAVDLGANSLQVGGNNVSSTFGGALTGTGGLTKIGAGTFVLTGSESNTYTGGTSVQGNTGSFLGLAKTGGAVAVPGTISLAAGASNRVVLYTLANNQFGPTSVLSLGTTNDNRFELRGTTQTLAGLDAAASTAAFIQHSEFTPGSNLGEVSNLIVNNASNFNWTSSVRNQGGTLTLAKLGAGTQTLTGNPITYTGPTSVLAGTLALNNTTAFASAAYVGPSGTLLVQPVSTATFTNRVTQSILTNVVTGPGTFTVAGATNGIAGSWLILNGSGRGLYNFTGTVNVTSGVLSMDNIAGVFSGNPDLNLSSGGLFAVRSQSINVNALTGVGTVFNSNNSDLVNRTLSVGVGGGSGTFTGAIAGNGTGADGGIDFGVTNLAKLGSGTQVLAPTATYTTTGRFSALGGVLELDYGSLAASTNLLAAAAPVTIGSGTLRFRGASTGATTQTIGGVTIAANTGGSLLVNPNGGTGTTITLGALAPNAGSSLLVGTAASAGAGTVTLSTTSTATAGIVNRLVFTDGTAFDWAAVSGTNLAAFSGYSALATAAGTDTNNARITGSTALAGSVTTNTLKIEGPPAGQSLDLGAANTLTLTGGGLLATGGQAFAISGGTLTAGNGVGAFEFVVNQYATGDLTIGSVIANNAANVTALTKAGPGGLVLSAANTYTGSTSVVGGTLRVAGGSSLGSGGLALGGGTLHLDSDTALTGSRAVTVAADSTLILGRATDGAGLASTFGALTFNDAFTLSVQKDANVTTGTAVATFTGLPQLGGKDNTNISSYRQPTFNVGADVEVNLSGAMSTTVFSLLRKQGAGTLAISGANTAWDPTNGYVSLDTGTLDLRHHQALGDGGTGANSIAVFMAGGTTLRYSADTVTANNADITLRGTGATLVANRATAGAGLTNVLDVFRSEGAFTLNVTGGSNVTSGTARFNFTSGQILGDTTLNVVNPATAGETVLALGATNQLGGEFAVTKTGSGTLLLTGANTFTGLVLREGVTELSAVGAQGYAGLVTLAGGTLRFSSSNTADVSARLAFAPEATAFIDTNGQTVSFASGIGSNSIGSLVKSGAGMLSLGAASTYTGTTTIQAGFLAIAGPSSLPGWNTTGRWSAAAGAGLAVGNGVSEADVATLLGTTNLAAGAYLGFDTAAGSRTYAGSIVASGGGAVGLAKIGGNTLTLTGANTFTGPTSIQGGTLSVSSLNSVSGGVAASSLGDPLTVADGTIAIGSAATGGTLLYTGPGETTDRVIDLAGTTGGATIDLTGSTGLLRFTSGLTATGAGAKTLTLAGGAGTFGELAGAVVNSSSATSLTKSGGGTWTLTGVSTYTGATTVSGGTLALAASGSLGPTTALNLSAAGAGFDISALAGASTTIGSLAGAAGSTVTLGGKNLVAGDATSTTFSGSIAGTGGINKLGSGTLTLAGANTFTGGLTLSAGAVALAAGATLANAPITYAGPTAASLSITDTNAVTLAQNIALVNPATSVNYAIVKTSNATPALGTLTLSGTITGGGPNTVLYLNTSAADGNTAFRFTGTNTYQGTLRMNRGRLLVGAASELGAATNTLFIDTYQNLTNGSVEFLADVSLPQSVVLSYATVGLNTNANNVSLSGVVSGSFGLAKLGVGTLGLAGTNTFTGATTISGGTLAISGAGQLGSGTYAGAITNSAALAVSTSANQSLSGVLSGSGTLAKSGVGTLTLSGANTYTGGTRLSAGTLLLGHAAALGSSSGLALDGGTLASSSAVIRTVTQAVTLGGDVTLGQTSGGTGQLAFTGPLDLGGGSRTLTTNADVALRGAVSNGSLVKAGPGTLVLGQTPSITALTITAGKTMVLSSSGLGAASVTLAGGELQLTQASGDLTGNLVLSGPAASNAISHGLAVDYLVVGGGGGGGARDSSGGGGGGGVLSNLVTGAAPLLLTSGTTSVVVGAGGAGGVGPDASGTTFGATGGSSTFGSVVALGGGGGGGYSRAGTSGATGGGSGRGSTTSVAGTDGQGFAGGGGTGGGTAATDTGGGGGGAGGVGQAGVLSSKGGDGGVGLAVTITGTTTHYGGGGGGTPHRSVALAAGAGGLGGGGAGAANANSNPTAGTANTGGGGGAARNDGVTGTGSSSGAAGGSGVVIVRYLGDAVASGGTITTGTGSSAGYTLHTFNAVGSSQFVVANPDRRITGVVSGSGGFTYATANSRLFLDAVNSYQGGTLVNAGTLVANAAGALGSGAVTVNAGGVLQSAVSGALGTAPVTLASGGRLNVAAVGGIGSSSVTAGSGSLVAFRTDGLSLAEMSTEAAGVTWQAGSALALDTTGGSFSLTQEFQPALGLAKVGANNLTIGFADSVRTGAVSVQQGGIRLGANGALGSAVVTLASGVSLASDGSTARSAANEFVIQGDVTLGDPVANGALALSGSVGLGGATRDLAIASPVTLSGVVTNGGLSKSGPGTLTLTGASTYAGPTTVVAGSIVLSGTGVLPAATALTLSTSGAALDLAAISGSSATIGSLAGVAGTTLTLGAKTLMVGDATTTTFTGVVADGGAGVNGSVTKLGTGTLALAGTNTFKGGLTVSAGSVRLNAAAGAGTGTITLGDAATGASAVSLVTGISPLTFANNIVVSALGSGTATIGSDGGTGGQPQIFSGSLTLNRATTLTSGTPDRTSYTGVISGNVGTLTIGGTNRTTFGNAGNNYVGSTVIAAGATLQIDVATGALPDATDLTVNGTFLFNASATETVASLSGSNTGNIQINSAVSGTHTLIINGAGSTTYSGTIQTGGTGTRQLNLTKQGSGTQVLSGNISTAGPITVSGGLLSLTGASTFSGNVVVNGGTLRLAGTGSIWSATKATADSLVVSGGGILEADRWTWGVGQSLGQLNYNNGYINVNGGTIRNVAAASTSFNNRGITVGASGITYDNATAGTVFTIASGTNNNTYAANASVTLAGAGGGDFQQTISGTGVSLVKSGAGTWTLSGAATHTGATTVTAGTLVLAGTFGASSAIAVNSGGTLRFGANDRFGNHQTTTSPALTLAAGGRLQSGGFFNTLVNPVLNGGSIELTGGQNTSFGAFGLKGTVTVGGSQATTISILSGTNNEIHLGPTDVAGVATFAVADATSSAAADLTVAAVLRDNRNAANTAWLASGLTKTGLGTMLLSGANTYTGATTISAGTLEVGGEGSLGGGAYAGAIANGGSLVFSTSANQTLLGMISGAGGVTKTGAGILTLAAASSFAGGVVVNGGRVDVADVASLGTGPVSIGSAGALRLSLAPPGAAVLSTLFGNGLSGTGVLDLNLAGQNPLSLGSYANFGGSVRVSSGVFDSTGFSGGVVFAGGRLLDPGSFTGTTTVSGPITDISQLPTGGTLVLDAGGSIDFGQTPYTGTILYRGGSVSGSGFQGILDVAAPSVAVSGSFGQGSLRVGAGREVSLTGPTTGTILFDGGSITGGGNLTGRLQLGAGRSLVLGAGLDVLPSTVTLGVGAGTSVDLGWSATAATIDFTGGSIANAANFAGTIAVSQNAIFSTNETVGGTVNLGSGTMLAGNGFFTGTVTAAAGSTLSPGSSPGLTSYQTLNLTGGAAVNLEFFSLSETVSIAGETRRGYDSLFADTLNFGTAGEVGGGSILLRLATLTNWTDMVPDWNGTSGFLPAEGSSLIHGPFDGPKAFVIARFNGSDRLGVLTDGLDVTPWFTFDTDLYRGTGASGFQVVANTGDTSAWELNMIAVPEPSAWGLLGGGAVVAAGLWRRRAACR